jgi:CheY-like chemotaxis protein
MRQKPSPKPVFRILLIEDDPGRTARLTAWLPHDLRIVVASSAGRAVGILRQDRGLVYGGILLDHDLQQQAITEADRRLSGSDVVNAIIANVDDSVPVLVHSMNTSRSPAMVSRLVDAGFSVTRIPMSELTMESLGEWVREARSAWQDLQE